MVSFWPRMAGLVIVAVLGTSVWVAWRAVRREQAQLQEKLKSAQEAVQQAGAREDSRKTELERELAQIERQKKEVQKPEQIVSALPSVLPLPKPLVVEQTAGADNKNEPEPKVELPAEDLKPLYDFGLGCKACQAELAAAQADLTDEKTKTQALSRERDSALRAARGGSVLARVARAAKWFAIGAAAGAVAVKMAH